MDEEQSREPDAQTMPINIHGSADEEQDKETDASTKPIDTYDLTSEREQRLDVPYAVLSYATADLEFVKKLHADLMKARIKVWMAPKNIPAGESWEKVLRETIRSASAVVYVASPSAYTSDYVRDELGLAVQYKRKIYPLWIEGDEWRDVAQFGLGGKHYIDARENYQNALQALVKILRQPLQPTKVLPMTESIDAPLSPPPRNPHQESRKAPHKTPRRTKALNVPEPEASDALHSPPLRNPYKSLRPFEQEDANDFFGRDQLIQKLVAAIETSLDSQHSDTSPLPRILAILGPSGSGKSSLVMAGLLPALQQGKLPNKREWIYLQRLRPGQRPIDALALVLAEHFPALNNVSLKADLRASEHGLHDLLIRLNGQRKARILLFIDQFEEIFAQTISEDERRHFLALLLTACTEPDGPCMLLPILRADFRKRLLHYHEFSQLVEENHIVMDRISMRDAIEKPARLPDVQLTFEENLVEDLLSDVSGQPGALPLLQLILDKLYQSRVERQLTRKAYQDIGGIKGVLKQNAELTHMTLPSDDHHDLARVLFLRMINPGLTDQDEDVACRRIPLSDLDLVDAQQTTWLKKVTDTFVEKRLLVTNIVANTPTIEIAHEALIPAWSSLKDWVKESYEDIRQQKTINEAAFEWRNRGQSVDRLYHGAQLAKAKAWSERHTPSHIESEFLQAALVEQERQQMVEEQETQRRKQYTRRMVVITSVAGGIGLIGLFTGVSALSHEYLPKSSPQLKVSIQEMPYSYRGHHNAVLSVAWSPDGKHLASASQDGTAQVWDVSTGTTRFTYRNHNAAMWSVAWSPDGERLASAGGNGTVQVWDAFTGHQRIYYGHNFAVESIAWSPDGKHLASSGVATVASSGDGIVQVWGNSTETPLFTYPPQNTLVQSVAWSPDNKYLALAGRDGTVQIWYASTGTKTPQLTYRKHSFTVESVTWSPNGKNLASAGVDKSVQVWDAFTKNTQCIYRGHKATVWSVAWSPDGEYLASASQDKTVQIWNASTGTLVFTYRGHNAAVWSVAWSPNGEYLASASTDNTVQVWPVRL